MRKRVFECWNERNRAWKTKEIRHVCDEESAEAILKIEWPHIQCRDKLIWLGNKEENFSVKSCYELLVRNSWANNENGQWMKLLKLKIHDSPKLFLWRVLSTVIPTCELLFHRFGKGNRFCVRCGVVEESAIHVFKDCNSTRRLSFASKWGCKLDCWTVSNTEDIVDFCINLKPENCFPNLEGREVTTFLSLWCRLHGNA